MDELECHRNQSLSLLKRQTFWLLLQAFDPLKRLPTLLGGDSIYLQLPHKRITRNVEELEVNNNMQVLTAV